MKFLEEWPPVTSRGEGCRKFLKRCFYKSKAWRIALQAGFIITSAAQLLFEKDRNTKKRKKFELF